MTWSRRCDVTSLVAVGVEWRRVGSEAGPLPSNAQLTESGRVLRLPRFSRSQAGTYECVATNRYGTDSDTSVITALGEEKLLHISYYKKGKRFVIGFKKRAK